MKDNPELKYFSALSDLLLKSIRNKETNLTITLSDFFYTAFKKVRDEFTNTPVVYPEIYYELVYKAIEELAILKEKRNYLLEHRTSGEIWLLGELQGKEISETTYQWMWRNLLLAIRYEQDDLIVNHWETCHQYYSYNLENIYLDYEYSENTLQVNNQEAVDKRTRERKRFIEFHYALGGLLVYKERYDCIKRVFSYTQSEPPRYDLLPESMLEIFNFYYDLKDPYERKYSWISSIYPFPNLSGLNADFIIKKNMMSYMALLFLRQYTIIEDQINIRPLDTPPIPNTQGVIKKWIDGIDFFKKMVSEHLENTNMLKSLSLDFITPDWCQKNNKTHPIILLETLKKNLKNAYHHNALNLPISDEKLQLFKNSTKKIIEETYNNLQLINNETPVNSNNCDLWYVNGQNMIQDKDAFAENPEVHHMEFDSFLANVVSKNMYEVLCETFFRKISKSYLFNSEDFFKAIDKLGIDDNFVIVNFGIDINFFITELKINNLSKEKYNNIFIHTFPNSKTVRDSLFILKKIDLPNISTKQIEKKTITKYSLEKISDNIDLYTSVIDLNIKNKDFFEEVYFDENIDKLRKSVLMSIVISTEFKWKKNIEVVQLKLYSNLFQKGIVNKLEDIISN